MPDDKHKMGRSEFYFQLFIFGRGWEMEPIASNGIHEWEGYICASIVWLMFLVLNNAA